MSIVLCQDTNNLSGATALLRGSHRWVNRFLRNRDTPISNEELQRELLSSQSLPRECPIQYASGQAGDVWLLHPWTVHSINSSTSDPRLACNPHLNRSSVLDLNRASGPHLKQCSVQDLKQPSRSDPNQPSGLDMNRPGGLDLKQPIGLDMRRGKSMLERCQEGRVVAVAGAAGYLGRRVVEHLLAQGIEVRALLRYVRELLGPVRACDD